MLLKEGRSLLSTYKSFQASVQEEDPNGFSGSGKTTVCRAEYQRGENYSESKLTETTQSSGT